MFPRSGLLVAGVALAGIGVAGVSNAQPSANVWMAATEAGGRCTSLNGMKVDAGTVEGAEPFAVGASISGGATPGATATADMCRARVLLKPVPGSEIRVEVWLPGNWNRKLMGIGGAGFDGSLSPGSAGPLNKAIGEGYAAVATDVGHAPGPPTLEVWAHKQPEKLVDFGHRGHHLAAVAAKQIIAAYYDDPVSQAYFVGCSNGGRDGIMLASRYPEDYDGIVAGAPAIRYTEVVTQLIWYSKAVHGSTGAASLSSKFKIVQDAVTTQCDGLDGVEDGVLENPRSCKFDPASLQCKGADMSDCLTQAEVGAFRKIYGGAKFNDGRRIVDGPAPGGENLPNNWDAWISGPTATLAGQEFYRWMVHDDPTWKIEDFDMDRDYGAALTRIAPVINADNPDIAAFTRRGGKLIVYQGWNDAAITPGTTVAYVDAVHRHIGPEMAGQVRLFMVPGMTHCAGGLGATSFDMQSALEDWVERGLAPERIIASRPTSEQSPLTRPLCRWPKVARYTGSGSTDDAANFTCEKP